MAHIINTTTLSGLSAAKKQKLKEFCEAWGPQTIGDSFPRDEDGSYKTTLTNAEVLDVLDEMVRMHFKNQIARWEADVARQQLVAQDPFAEESQ